MGIGFGKIKTNFDKKYWVTGKILEHQANTIPNKHFLQYMNCEPLTYQMVNNKVNMLAHGFMNIGVKKFDTIMIMLPNSLEYLYTWFAANKVGAVEVPVNNSYKGSFFEHVANNSKAKYLVLNEDQLDMVYNSIDNLMYLETLIYVGDNKGALDKLNNTGKYNILYFNDIYSDNTTNPDVDVSYMDLGAIMYTSGTTGPSKGVMMPHAHLYTFSESNVNMLKLDNTDIYYTSLPFFHGNAQVLTIYPSLIAGSKVVIYPRFSASEWVGHLKKHEITVTNLIGVMMDFIIKQPNKKEDSELQLKAIFSVPTPAALVDIFRKRFNVTRILEGYGMTEIGMVTIMPFDDFRAGSCGKILDEWYEIKIVDPETDEEVPDETIGELVVRHKIPWALNAGYYGMPEKTVEAYKNLWFHTGDALKKDNDGFYYFIDRIKDALRRRGENISSYEVEKVVNDHPSVLESAAIAAKSDVSGGEDEVKICVVLKDGCILGHEELIQWCDKRMPYYCVPRYIIFMKDLPKTPSLKVQKAILRKLSINNVDVWDRVKEGIKLADEIKREKKKLLR